MKIPHRFQFLVLVVAAFVQPAFAVQPTVEFELDNSTNFVAYEETLPMEGAEQVPIVGVQPVPEPTKTTMPEVRSNPKVVEKQKSSAKYVKSAAEPEAVAQDIPLIETQNNVIVSPDVRYVTGGVGEDEARDIIASKADYNLYVMSANEAGSFVGDARVVIARKQGVAMEIVLDVVAGPLLYVALPVGSYTLSANLGMQSKRQAFVVKEKGAPRNIHLGWHSASVKPAVH